jgi:hypothetical protein
LGVFDAKTFPANNHKLPSTAINAYSILLFTFLHFTALPPLPAFR